jgi:hypothetical protein
MYKHEPHFAWLGVLIHTKVDLLRAASFACCLA